MLYYLSGATDLDKYVPYTTSEVQWNPSFILFMELMKYDVNCRKCKIMTLCALIIALILSDEKIIRVNC
jgi:hypothetical protein